MTPFLSAAALIFSAAFPASHASSGAQDAGDTDVVAARADAADRMTVPVHIEGRGPYRFLLDTGAQNTVIASSLARELSLAPGGRAQVVGVAGRQSVETVEVGEILLGRRSAAVLAPLLEREHIGADGILGIDSLQGQRVLLDFRRNLIAVDQPGSIAGDSGYEIIVRAKRRGGQLIVTNADVDGVRTMVVIDTGAEATVGNPALQRALSRRVDAVPALLSSVTGQSVMADVGMARVLRLGDLDIRNVGIAFTNAPAFEQLDLSDRPALLLGMRELRAFRRVAIDFTTRKVLFDI